MSGGLEGLLRLCEDATGLLVGPTGRRLAALAVHSLLGLADSDGGGAGEAGSRSPGGR